MCFINRLEEIIKSSGLTQGEFCQKVGIAEKTVISWKDKKSNIKPRINNLKKVCSIDNYNPEWLKLGKGEKKTGNSKKQHSPSKVTHNVSETDYTYIKLYEVAVVAGNGVPVENEIVLDVLAFKTSWIRNELRLDPSKLSLIFVTGDSMNPTLSAGDMILVDHAATGSITEGVWVLSMGDGPIVKRVERLSRNEIRVSSDNKKYTPREISLDNPPEGMQFIGRVVWSGGRM